MRQFVPRKLWNTSFELAKVFVSSGRFSVKTINISTVLALKSSLLRGFIFCSDCIEKVMKHSVWRPKCVSSGRFSANIINISTVSALKSSLLRGFYSVCIEKVTNTSFELVKMLVSSGRCSAKIINIPTVLALHFPLLTRCCIWSSVENRFSLVILNVQESWVFRDHNFIGMLATTIRHELSLRLKKIRTHFFSSWRNLILKKCFGNIFENSFSKKYVSYIKATFMLLWGSLHFNLSSQMHFILVFWGGDPASKGNRCSKPIRRRCSRIFGIQFKMCTGVLLLRTPPTLIENFKHSEIFCKS